MFYYHSHYVLRLYTPCYTASCDIPRRQTDPYSPSKMSPLCISAIVGIASRSTPETCWQECPVRLLLWQSWPLRPDEIYTRVGVLSCRQKLHVRNQVSTEGVAKRWLVNLQVPLVQGQSDEQGRYRVAASNSSYAKPQDAYNDLIAFTTRVLVASFVYSCSFWDVFHVNNSIWKK